MKILTAIDFSTATEPVLQVTKLYARKFQAEVILLHVEPCKRRTGKPGPEADEADDFQPDTRPEHFRLEKDAKALKRCGVKASSVLLDGPVNETIAAEAERREADLIITGSRGHNILKKTPIGSTSEGLLKLAKIPVLIVPFES